MSFCTYIASDKPLSKGDYLWPLSRGGEDIYTEKVYVAQIVPDLDDLSGVLCLARGCRCYGVGTVWGVSDDCVNCSLN